MPLPLKDAQYDTDRQKETEKVRVDDIMPCEETKELPNGREIKFPYKIKIVDQNGNVVFEERTTPTLKPRDWNKKFYLNSSGFVGYSRDNSLLALAAIKQKTTGEVLPAQGNLNDTFIGFEFEAAVIRTEGGNTFIDWVDTFRVNKVRVPNDSELKMTGTAKENAAVEKEFGGEDPLADLPF